MIGSTMFRRKTRLSVLAATVLVLSGCGSVNPGAAAVVGSTSIPHDRVDGLAQALCTATIKGAEAQGQPAPEEPTKGVRQSAMQILLETELSQKFGEQRGVDPNQQQVSQALAQNQPLLEVLPEQERADYREALTRYAEGQLMLIEIGRRSLEEKGQTEVTNEEATAEGQRLRQQFAQGLDVEVDPRYGTLADNALRPGGSSLSVAASEGARAGDKPDAGPAFVSELPASQKCS